MTEDWAIPGGKALNWEIKYVVHFTQPLFPVAIELRGIGALITEPHDLPAIVQDFVDNHGLDQITLCDAYDRVNDHISVSYMVKPW